MGHAGNPYVPRSMTQHMVGQLAKDGVKRVCSSCGFKDRSVIPPVNCPRCHFEPDSPMNEQNKLLTKMNRHERRRQDAQRRQQERKVNKQLKRENPSGKYEAS